MTDAFSLDGKVTLITGAGAGQGRVMAKSGAWTSTPGLLPRPPQASGKRLKRTSSMSATTLALKHAPRRFTGHMVALTCW